MTFFKTRVCRSQKLRDSARGERCTVEAEVCITDQDPGHATTVLAHLPDESGTGKMGGKSDDWCAAYACAACHTWVDQYQDEQELQTFHRERALKRTLRRMIEKGLITIQGAKYL